jgi:CRISPR system Cascade subunit CasA
MQFNLIDEQWIPVLRRDGRSDKIAPHEVTKGFAENPVVSLDAPRADFNGALIQFLIGLVQTVAAPKREKEWRKKLEEPPSPDQLKGAFASVRKAFELGGDGPRFMQDFSELEVEYGGIDGLLIDMPGESTQKHNKDHFVKRNSVEGMCPSCCATALFTMQTNAPAGGAGFRTSLRGGGPLSTIIAGDEGHLALWQLVWLNVLEHNSFQNLCGNPTEKTSNKFPWLAPTRTSEQKSGVESTPESSHPAVLFWGMPRRIRLNLKDVRSGVCDTCGAKSTTLITQYKEKNYGMNFAGAWLHPLSPYGTTADGLVLPIHAQPGGITYRHWLGLAQQNRDEGKMPARVVHEFVNQRCKPGWQFRLRAFGYDMDNMKARCWYESTMPLLYIEPAILNEFEGCTAGMVRAAGEIAYNTRSAVKKAWFRRPGDAKGDTTFLDSSFWQDTESAFYEAVDSIKNALELKKDCSVALQVWHKALCQHALNLFDKYAWERPIEDADPKRVVVARKELELYNRGNKIKELLGLQVKQEPMKKVTKKKHVMKNP